MVKIFYEFIASNHSPPNDAVKFLFFSPAMNMIPYFIGVIIGQMLLEKKIVHFSKVRTKFSRFTLIINFSYFNSLRPLFYGYLQHLSWSHCRLQAILKWTISMWFQEINLFRMQFYLALALFYGVWPMVGFCTNVPSIRKIF